MSATNYTYASGNLLTWGASDAAIRSVIPVAGVASQLYVEVGTAPAAGKSWALTFVKNGSDTGVTCTIADTATTCSDLAHTFTLAAGDTLSLKSVPSGTPTSPGQFRFGWVFTGTANASSIILGSSRAIALATGTTEYNGLQMCGAGNATLNLRDQVMPTAGTIDKLYVELDGAPGTAASGKNYAITVLKGGSAQTLTCTITDTATTCNDTTHSFSVSAGDLVAIQFVPGSTPTARVARWGVRWTPTIEGEAVFLHSDGGAMNTAGSVRYVSPSGTTQTWTSTESTAQSLTTSFTLKKLYVNLVTDPNPGSYTLKSRIGGADGTLSVSIASGSTTGNDTTHTDTVANAAKIDVSQLSASSPTASVARFGFVALAQASPYTVTFNSGSGTFHAPFSGTLVIEQYGGGGGGGEGDAGGSGVGGSGGGGGAYNIKTVTVAAGDIATYSVGAAGIGNTDSGVSCADGGAGGNSTVVYSAVTYTAGGGAGGPSCGSTSGGAGGTSTNGDFNRTGGAGAGKVGNAAGGGGSSAGTAANGNAASGQTGGTAPTGGAAGGNGGNSGVSGVAGTAPGGGGGGGGKNSFGANGGAGRIIFTLTSDSPTPTPTPTNTPTNTPTDTPTLTPTPTNTFTLTPTPTNTFTVTPTPTNTATPTNTFTPVPTVSGVRQLLLSGVGK